jgi:hypothetical protein
VGGSVVWAATQQAPKSANVERAQRHDERLGATRTGHRAGRSRAAAVRPGARVCLCPRLAQRRWQRLRCTGRARVQLGREAELCSRGQRREQRVADVQPEQEAARDARRASAWTERLPAAGSLTSIRKRSRTAGRAVRAGGARTDDECVELAALQQMAGAEDDSGDVLVELDVPRAATSKSRRRSKTSGGKTRRACRMTCSAPCRKSSTTATGGSGGGRSIAKSHKCGGVAFPGVRSSTALAVL